MAKSCNSQSGHESIQKLGIFPFDVNAVDLSRIMKYKGDGDGNGEGDQDVQEEAAVNILGNVVNEMGDGLEVAIEVEIKTTGANAKNEMQEDEIQAINQSEGTQQENIESTEQHTVQCSEQEQVEMMHEPEAGNVQRQPGEMMHEPEAENAQQQPSEMMHEPEAENAQQQPSKARDVPYICQYNFNFGLTQVSAEPE